jgi:hypothetical protein
MATLQLLGVYRELAGSLVFPADCSTKHTERTAMCSTGRIFQHIAVFKETESLEPNCGYTLSNAAS